MDSIDDNRSSSVVEDEDDDSKVEIDDADCSDMRHSIYANKLRALEQELELLESGQHPEYLNAINKIQMQYCERLADIRAQADLKKARDRAEYERRKEQTTIEFNKRKEDLIKSMEQSVEEQKRWIELEHSQLDINADVVDVKPPPARRHLRRRHEEQTPETCSRRRAPGADIDSAQHIQLLGSSTRIGNLIIGSGSATSTPNAPGDTGSIGNGGAALLKLITPLNEFQVDDDLALLGIDATLHRRPPSHQPPSTPGSQLPCVRLKIDAGDRDADIQGGRLTHNDKEYLRGQQVQIETTDLGSVHAVIQSINADEVLLKSVGDGKRFSISLKDIREGKCAWRKRSNH